MNTYSRPALSPSKGTGPLSQYSDAFTLCVEKTASTIATLADSPKSGAYADDGDYFSFEEGFFDIGNWTSSFFTGMALLAFESTGEIEFLRQTNRLSDFYHDKVTRRGRETMHDLGFLFSLYSVPLHRLTGCPAHRRTGLQAADMLAKRFSPRGGYLRAWGAMDEVETEYAGLAIIDCLMNLPLLFWASRETGNRFYADLAITHAHTTLRHFVRPDASVCHAFRFDIESEKPLRPDNYCGRAVESHWARGTAWAIYGFALAFRHSGERPFRDASLRLAKRFVALLDDEIVPVWDFSLPPGEPRLRDSSAAAIAVCGIDELLKHQSDSDLQRAAEELLTCLCSPAYLNSDLECGGILRQGEVGDGIGKAKSVYTSWGDYYFMEALARRVHGINPHWR